MKWYNEYEQEIGYPIKNWEPKRFPEKVTLEGKYCRIEPLNIENHVSRLYEAHQDAGNDMIWTYLPIGPFHTLEEYRKVFVSLMNAKDQVHYAIINKETNHPVGQLALIKIDNQNGVAEVGYVIFTKELQKTTMATEAHYLLMSYVFDTLHYRRLEWRCDSLNEPSKRSALRLGYQFEGTFRQMVVYKGRNRDTSWLSIIDHEWEDCGKAFRKWLSVDNFENGKQIQGLADIRTSPKTN